MRTTFAIAALAGSAFAAPSYGFGHKKEVVQNVHVVVETVVHTLYVTEGAQKWSKPTRSRKPWTWAPAKTTVVATTVVAEPTSQAPAPVVPSSTYEAPAPVEPAPTSPAPAPVEPTPTPEAPKPTPTPSPAPAPAPAPQAGYMGIVDEWRAKLGLKALIHDDKLEANVLDCVKSSNGQMVHKLNSGSYGQVLAPGKPEDFEHCFVGGWLCEIPTLSGLDGVCTTQSKGWSYNGQTGHAEILTNPKYTKIACANYNGIWGCDLAY